MVDNDVNMIVTEREIYLLNDNCDLGRIEVKNLKKKGKTCRVRVSNSGLPMQDSFERILNEIPCVNSFPLYLLLNIVSI